MLVCMYYMSQIIFKKAQVLPGRIVHCTGHVCGKTILRQGESYWRNSTWQTASPTNKSHSFRLCQKCFGFWLNRYTDFDYDPTNLDLLDLRWEKYWDNNLQKRALELIAEDLNLNTA